MRKMFGGTVNRWLIKSYTCDTCTHDNKTMPNMPSLFTDNVYAELAKISLLNLLQLAA